MFGIADLGCAITEAISLETELFFLTILEVEIKVDFL
jgi:hypothetical protein